jgi:hypothetical protein
MIYKDDKVIQLCKLDAQGEIVFTPKYLEATKELGPGARQFACYLITYFAPEFKSLLDYFCPDDSQEDKYSGEDGTPMDVREDLTDLWAYRDPLKLDLDGEWHRDILRSKLISIKIPERLIKEYVKRHLERKFGK